MAHKEELLQITNKYSKLVKQDIQLSAYDCVKYDECLAELAYLEEEQKIIEAYLKNGGSLEVIKEIEEDEC